MQGTRLFIVILLFIVLFTLVLKLYIVEEAQPISNKGQSAKNNPVPVMSAPLRKGDIELIRNFNGTLEPQAEFFVSPKVGGIIESLTVNLGDSVKRKQVIAQLDSIEFDQDILQAEAELEIAKANLQQAQSLLEIAERELKRIDQLNQRGVSSEFQRDAAYADQQARKAEVQVSKAELVQAKARLEVAHIRRNYTQVTADWMGEDDQRLVAERLVDEGETVKTNTPLVKIVNLDPVIAVFNVTEKDYVGLSNGQKVSLVTDAYPMKSYLGIIERIAPVFHEASRQARIEVRVENPHQELKPGMFVRAKVILKRAQKALIIPHQALTQRDGTDGVFVISENGKSVHWKSIQKGIRQGEDQQILNDDLAGDVVILGQQALKDGSSVVVSNPDK